MGLLSLARKTILVPPDLTVADAVTAMTEREKGSALVVAGGRLVGIFTERDLMTRVVARGRDPNTTLLAEVMTTPVRTIEDGASPAVAAAIMRDHHMRHLPVLDAAGRVGGMLALRYLLYEVMDDLERKVDGLESFIMADAPGG
jgi:CBS domain-containing protein